MIKESYLQFLLDILYCTQNDKFCCFLETKICFVKKKLFNIFLGLRIYFVQKSVKMILEDHSLKSFWTTHYMFSHLLHILSYFYDLSLA